MNTYTYYYAEASSVSLLSSFLTSGGRIVQLGFLRENVISGSFLSQLMKVGEPLPECECLCPLCCTT